MTCEEINPTNLYRNMSAWEAARKISSLMICFYKIWCNENNFEAIKLAREWLIAAIFFLEFDLSTVFSFIYFNVYFLIRSYLY